MNRAVGKAAGLIAAIVAVLTLWELVPMVGAQQIAGRGVRGAAAVDASLSDPDLAPVRRLREGSTLSDQLGVFKVNGDRIDFVPAEQEHSLQVLENLALERVWKMLDEARGRQWRVNGSVTEYRGRNYLLIERVVLSANLDGSVASP